MLKRLSFIIILTFFMIANAIKVAAYEYPYGSDGFNNDTPKWDQQFDRSAARQWEMNPPKGHPTLAKENIPLIKQAIKRYAKVVSDGGWRKIPKAKNKYYVGIRAKEVPLIRKRLELTGDLEKSSSYSKVYDYYVEQAVKRFQVRHGLTPSGLIDRRTRAAMNVSASIRLRQLRTNVARMYSLVRNAAKSYVLVNIPAQQVEVIENGQILSRHAAVVGKIDRQTPRLRSRIHEINFNPYWNVPQSIVRKDLIPKAKAELRKGRNDILDRYRISAFDGNGRKLNPRKINWNSPSALNYRYRQDPWKDNSMGFVKINFHNAHAVYMHDTPSKSLFGRNLRANSSGCIRVQNVKQLVTWLLRENTDWSRGRVDEMQKNGKRKDVRLKTRTPLYFIYVTSWATKDGTVHFRRDLYKEDGVGDTVARY